MKRSKMENLLYHEFYRKLDLPYDHSARPDKADEEQNQAMYDAAKIALDFLESQGMLPPKYTKILDGSGVKREGYFRFETDEILGVSREVKVMPNYYEPNEWEPEDDSEN